MNSKGTKSLISKRIMHIVYICDFDLSFLGSWGCQLFTLQTLAFWNHIESITQVSCAFFPDCTQNLMLIHNFKGQSLTHSLTFAMRCRNTHIISVTNSTQLALMHWNHNWCKFKDVQTCIHCCEVAWLSFLLHSKIIPGT